MFPLCRRCCSAAAIIWSKKGEPVVEGFCGAACEDLHTIRCRSTKRFLCAWKISYHPAGVAGWSTDNPAGYVRTAVRVGVGKVLCTSLGCSSRKRLDLVRDGNVLMDYLSATRLCGGDPYPCKYPKIGDKDGGRTA